MPHPHVRFLIALVILGPLSAILGVVTGGLWAPAGVSVAGLLVAVTAARSAMVLRHEPRGFLQMRMLGLTATVALCAALLSLGALAVFVVDLVR
jgi:hypothetical protein